MNSDTRVGFIVIAFADVIAGSLMESQVNVVIGFLIFLFILAEMIVNAPQQ